MDTGQCWLGAHKLHEAEGWGPGGMLSRSLNCSGAILKTESVCLFGLSGGEHAVPTV